MGRRTLLVRLVAATAAILAGTGVSHAGLLPAHTALESEAGYYRWTYSIVLPTDMQLQSGNSFTIHDFAGYQAGSAEVAWTSWDNRYAQDWTLTTAPTNPDGMNPGTVNLTWTYSGPTIAGGKVGLGNFSAASDLWGSADGVFTGSAVRSSDGQVINNVASTWVPAVGMGPPPISLPEPGTLLLAALGLPLAGLSRLLRRKRAVGGG